MLTLAILSTGVGVNVETSAFLTNRLVEEPTQETKAPLSVKFSFNSVKSDGTLSYDVSVKNRTEQDIVTRYSIEILDDRGNTIVDPKISSDFRFSSNSENIAKVDHNPFLEDGYYVLRVRAVSIDKKGNQFNAFDEAFIEIIKGNKEIIEEGEFNALSLINIGIKQPESKETK